MRSIDNLREYALTAASVNATTRAVLAGYIDEIEREVEELRDRDYRNGREDADGAVEFADRLKAAVDKREDVTLWGVDYTPVPVDAEGVPIHVGDVMEADNGTTFEVEHISLYQWGWRCIGEGTDRSGVTCTAHAIPDGCRHHHAPTVEDVLREFAHVGIRIAAKHGIKAGEIDFYADEEAIAEFAAKLRLAGEDA
jgi:hypothetical protein